MKKLFKTMACILLGTAASTVVAEVDTTQGIWIDVRSVAEYSTGNVEGAINIPHTDVVDRIGEVTSDKEAQINLYCRSGRRASWVKKDLEALGFTNVVNHGGYSSLK